MLRFPGLLLLSFACGCASTDDTPIALFNGEDLSGWSVKAVPADQNQAFWSVQDGAIEANSMGRPEHNQVWLQHEKEFGDFELTLEFQAFRSSPGNSGVQVRSRYDSGPEAPNGGYMDGPQVDVHPPTPWRTGMIYDETRGTQRWIAPSLPDWRMPDSLAPDVWRFVYADEEGGWNELRIVCRGTRVTTYLNGIQMRDYDGAGLLDDENHRARDVGMRGHVALQLHVGDETRIRYRAILVRALEPR